MSALVHFDSPLHLTLLIASCLGLSRRHGFFRWGAGFFRWGAGFFRWGAGFFRWGAGFFRWGAGFGGVLAGVVRGGGGVARCGVVWCGRVVGADGGARPRCLVLSDFVLTYPGESLLWIARQTQTGAKTC